MIKYQYSSTNNFNVVYVLKSNIAKLLLDVNIFNPFTATDHFGLIQDNEWKSPIKLLSVEMVKDKKNSVYY